MSFTLITFIVSGSLMVFMIAFKLFQEKFEILLFWPQLRNRIEHVLQYYYKSIKYFITHISKQRVYSLLQLMMEYVQVWFARVVQKLDRRSFHLISLVKGKQKVEKEGKVSHFLNDIRDYRDNFREH